MLRIGGVYGELLRIGAALVIIKPNCTQNVAPKMDAPRSPILEPMRAISVAVSKYINPACQVNMGDHMTRPFFQPKSSPISRSMKPRRSQSHIPNCSSCCSKSSAADTQWETPDMCVRCFGCLHLVQVAVCFGQMSLTHFLDLGWWVRKCIFC